MNRSDMKKKQLLVADDSEMNRSMLADILEEEFDVLEAADGVEAIEMLEKYGNEISAVLLDIVMPQMNGFEVLSVMNRRHWIEEIPVIIISAESGSKQIERAFDLGATDFIMRPFDAMLVYRRVINTVLLYAKQKRLLELVIDQINEKERRSQIMVNILSHIVEFRNGESSLHVVNVHTFTELMLLQLQRLTDQYELTQAEISIISTASALHDIGKMAVDEKILNKPGRLTPEEFEEMKRHTVMGAQMLENLPEYQDEQMVKTAWAICRWHHERYDGGGYPDGLKGDEIPISAQVVALADVYDALTSDRCYKKAIPHKIAIQMILDGQCGVFNPLLVRCLQQMEDVLGMKLTANQLSRQNNLRSNLLQEIFKGERQYASDRSLRLMAQEREKFNSFSAMTNETQFEYNILTDTLTISEWGAGKHKLDQIITDPMHNEKLLEVLGENNLKEICGQCRSIKTKDALINGEYQFRIDGETHWYRLVARLLWTEDGSQCVGVLGKTMDIHDSRLYLDNLEKRASHDAATGLLNRASAKEQIIQRLQMMPEGNFALGIFDLDYLKRFNDTYGHVFGSQVLKYVAERAQRSVRGDDIVARIGGDEFLLFLSYHTGIENVIQRIFNSIIGNYEGKPVSVSMGISLSEQVGHDYDALFQAADKALYSAKRAGRGQLVYYDDSMRELLSGSAYTTQEEVGR